MLAIDRSKKIMSLLQENGSVMVPELGKLFNVTEETVRRDLEKLEKDGLLKRTHGGATLNESIKVDLPLNIREVTNAEGKKRIGEKVAEYIEDGETIILDSSSTALQVAESIRLKRNLTIITNSVKVLMILKGNNNCKIISTGGDLRQKSMSLVGHQAENMLNNYNVDKVIISCKGIDKYKGIMESNEMESEVKKCMINSAHSVLLMADHTKFDKVSFVKMMKLCQINFLFTDEKIDDEWENILRNNNVTIVYC